MSSWSSCSMLACITWAGMRSTSDVGMTFRGLQNGRIRMESNPTRNCGRIFITEVNLNSVFDGSLAVFLRTFGHF